MPGLWCPFPSCSLVGGHVCSATCTCGGCTAHVTPVRYAAMEGMDRKQSFHDTVGFAFRFSCEQESLLANPMVQKEQVDATFGRPRITSEIQKRSSRLTGR
jgi:hypothetical protein